MKKVKRFLFLLSIVSIFLFNMVVTLDGSSLLGKDVSAKKAERKTKYEDVFDINMYLPGPVIKIGICCQEDRTDGCWRIWRYCNNNEEKKVK